jgi:hypothetical protein
MYKMVYMSGSKAARNQASIVNRTNICGGNKKGGLAPRSGYWFMQSNPSLQGASQRLPIVCVPNRTIQTQKYGYSATHGGNMG